LLAKMKHGALYGEMRDWLQFPYKYYENASQISIMKCMTKRVTDKYYEMACNC